MLFVPGPGMYEGRHVFCRFPDGKRQCYIKAQAELMEKGLEALLTFPGKQLEGGIGAPPLRG